MNFKNTENTRINIILIFIFIFIGVYLRVVGLNRAEGLWYDEINTYFIAKHQFPAEIFRTLLDRDLHFPLFYFILHFWMKFFGENDFAIRCLPLLSGILTLPVSYFVGRELNGPRGGLITLVFFSINSGLIYFSQEVRFYSLLVLLSTLVALFLVRISKNPSKLDYFGLTLANLLIIYTWTLGCVYVFIEMLLFFTYLIHSKQKVKNFVLSGFITLFLSLPIIPLLMHFTIRHHNLIFNYFDYYQISVKNFSRVIRIIAGCLSPQYFPLNNIVFSLVLFCTTIFFIFSLKAITKQKILLTLFLISFVPFLIGLIFAMQNKFSLTYSHVIILVPFFVIVASCGIFHFKNKFLASTLLICYIFLTLFYDFANQNSVRFYGFNEVAMKMTELKATPQDTLIIIPYGGYIATKYDYKAKIVPLCLNDYSFNSGDTFKYIFDSAFIKSLNANNAYDKLKGFVSSKKPTERFQNFIKNEVVATTPKNKYIYLVKIHYGLLPFGKNNMMDGLTNKITNDILNILLKDERIKPIEIKYSKSWIFIIFKRIK